MNHLNRLDGEKEDDDVFIFCCFSLVHFFFSGFFLDYIILYDLYPPSNFHYEMGELMLATNG